MTRNRIQDVARDENNSPLVGASVSLRRLVDNSEIDSTVTDASGIYAFTEGEVGYPGPIKVRITSLDGVTRERTGRSTGQTGTYFHSDLMRAFSVMTDGVVLDYDNELAVTADGVGMDVSVNSGLAFVSGHPLFFPAAQTVTITANASGNPRIDTIAINFVMPGESEEGEATIIAIAGSPAGSPVAPTLTQTTTLWQIRLANVAVANGASSISLGNVTDGRTYSTGPLVDNSIETSHLQDLAVTNAKVATGIDAVKLADGSVTNAELQYINTLTSNAQTQIDSKAATSHTHLLAAGASDVTATAAEVNVLDGVTATTAELNILDGVTATALELNVLDGITSTVAELNYSDGVTSAIQPQLDAKLSTSTAASTYAPLAGATFTGDVTITDGTELIFDGGVGSDLPLSTNGVGDLIIDGGIIAGFSGQFTVDGTGNTGVDDLTAVGQATVYGNIEGRGDLVLGTATTGGKIRIPERTSQPTLSLGSAAGTGGTAISMIRGGSDTAGTMRITTGSSGVTTGIIATVTFATARASTEYQAQVEGQSADARLGFSVEGMSTTKFDITCSVAPGVSDTVDIAYFVVDMV